MARAVPWGDPAKRRGGWVGSFVSEGKARARFASITSRPANDPQDRCPKRAAGGADHPGAGSGPLLLLITRVPQNKVIFNNHRAHDRGCCGASGRRYAVDPLRDAGARWVRWGSLLLLAVLALALGAQAAAADPVGQITEFSSSLNAGSIPQLIARSGRRPVVRRAGDEPGDRADHPSGQITEFSSGLNAGSIPVGIAPKRTATCGSPTGGRPGRSGGSPRAVRSPSSQAA